MSAKQEIDWSTGKKCVLELERTGVDYKNILEFAPSPNGETLALITKEDSEFKLRQNDEVSANGFEKLWQLRYLANGNVSALAMNEDMWCMSINGESSENQYPFAWNPIFSEDGESYALMIKKGMDYSLELNGKAWESKFLAIRDHCISADGQHLATTCQVNPLKSADIDTFFKGTYGVAVDDKVWENAFVGMWNPTFSSDASRVACECRVTNSEYTIAVNGKAWNQLYPAVWQPCFRPGGYSVFAPVRTAGNWAVVKDGELFWDTIYSQLWHLRFSNDGKQLAAVVSPTYGNWTIAVDDKPWTKTFKDMVQAPVFSDDGKRIAAIVKENNIWGIAVDGEVWPGEYEMVWNPVFSPSGAFVAAKVDEGGGYAMLVNGQPVLRGVDKLWDPVFNDDSSKILLRYIVDGSYFREVREL